MVERDHELAILAALLRERRWGALATVEADGQPYASAVAFTPEADLDAVLLHLSRLAPHTRNLLRDPRASLVVSAPEETGDPQTLARVSLLGQVEIVERDAAGFSAAKQRYLARLPDAAPLFEFADFVLFRLVVREARYVGGFARARRLEPAALRGISGEKRDSRFE